MYLYMCLYHTYTYTYIHIIYMYIHMLASALVFRLRELRPLGFLDVWAAADFGFVDEKLSAGLAGAAWRPRPGAEIREPKNPRRPGGPPWNIYIYIYINGGVESLVWFYLRISPPKIGPSWLSFWGGDMFLGNHPHVDQRLTGKSGDPWCFRFWEGRPLESTTKKRVAQWLLSPTAAVFCWFFGGGGVSRGVE